MYKYINTMSSPDFESLSCSYVYRPELGRWDNTDMVGKSNTASYKKTDGPCGPLSLPSCAMISRTQIFTYTLAYSLLLSCES